MKVKSESEVAQSCPTLSDPMDWSLPGSSVHGIFQARVQEWGAIMPQDILHIISSCCFINHFQLFGVYMIIGMSPPSETKNTLKYLRGTLNKRYCSKKQSQDKWVKVGHVPIEDTDTLS